MPESERNIQIGDPELGRAKALDELKTADAFLCIPLQMGNQEIAICIGGDAALIPRLLDATCGAVKLLAEKNLDIQMQHLHMINFAKEAMDEMREKMKKEGGG